MERFTGPHAYEELVERMAAGHGDVHGSGPFRRLFGTRHAWLAHRYLASLGRSGRADRFVTLQTDDEIDRVRAFLARREADEQPSEIRFVLPHVLGPGLPELYAWDDKVGVCRLVEGETVVEITSSAAQAAGTAASLAFLWSAATDVFAVTGGTSEMTALERNIDGRRELINLTYGYPVQLNPAWIREHESSVTSDVLERADPYALAAQICDYFTRFFAAPRAYLTDTASEALAVALATVTRSPGDEVLLLDNGFDAYPGLLSMCQARPVYVPRRPDDGLDVEAVRRRLTRRTAAFLLCQPENPLGTVHTAEEVEELMALCTERGICLVADHTFSLLSPYGVEVPLVSKLRGAERLSYVVIGDTGKIVGLHGTKVGVLLPSADMEARVVSSLDNLFFQMATPKLHVLAAILSDARFPAYAAELNAAVARNYAYIRDNLDRAIRVIRPQATSMCLLDVSELGVSDRRFADRLAREHGVALVPGAFFYKGPSEPVVDVVRAALARPHAQIVEAVSRMNAFASTLTR